jgi:4-hydroxy-tetrahydrodipicolinate synthase
MTTTTAPYGRLMTAMITPMTPDGAVDYDGAAALARYLVGDMRNEGLVVNGTTGEAPTTTDEEKARLVTVVREAVGDRATVIAGVGTNDTHHTSELARAAEKAGADGILVVTPYYNKPPQAGLLRHFTSVADSCGLPMMVYDIPGRSGVEVATETLCRLAEHERIIAVKDAKGDLGESSWVLSRTDLAYYSGEDKLTLPLLSVGAVGVVGVPTHIFGPQTKEMILAYEQGQVDKARALHLKLLPAFCGFFRTQGVMMAKAALALLGLPSGPVRPPLVSVNAAELGRLRDDCADAGRIIGTADQIAHHEQLGIAL